MQRLQCRDLYDLHELLVVNNVDAEALWSLFERKARHRDRDPGRFGESFADRVLRWEERWDRELIDYIASPPEFDGVFARGQARVALRSRELSRIYAIPPATRASNGALFQGAVGVVLKK